VDDGVFMPFVVHLEKKKKKSDRSFEDHKRMMTEIKSFLFNTHFWTVVLDYPILLCFLIFLSFFSF
jgi:hypothetical protein